jgi:uncharacterized protein YndB with AHSA1/START domain
MSVTVDTLEDGPTRIRLRAHLPHRTPSEVYRDWTEAERVQAWWGPDATLDLREGGAYEFRWTKLSAVLRGKYTRVDPGRRLDFSWAWADEPEREKQVRLDFRSDGRSGTLLEVTHGPYSQDPRDAELRQQHLDGWKIHLPKLADGR